MSKVKCIVQLLINVLYMQTWHIKYLPPCFIGLFLPNFTTRLLSFTVFYLLQAQWGHAFLLACMSVRCYMCMQHPMEKVPFSCSHFWTCTQKYSCDGVLMVLSLWQAVLTPPFFLLPQLLLSSSLPCLLVLSLRHTENGAPTPHCSSWSRVNNGQFMISKQHCNQDL